MMTVPLKEGYSIHVVAGPLPECAADQILRVSPAVQSQPPKLIGEDSGRAGRAAGLAGAAGAAAGASGGAVPKSGAGVSSGQIVDEDEALRQAMALSLAQQGGGGAAAAVGGGSSM